jgi:hypothetical protein
MYRRLILFVHISVWITLYQHAMLDAIAPLRPLTQFVDQIR